MTVEECVFAADYYLPVCVGESEAVYRRIYKVVKTWPDPEMRERKIQAAVSVVLIDPKRRDSLREVPPDMVRPAEPERFRESYEAFRKNFGNKK